MRLSNSAKTVLEKRYLTKVNGKVNETPEQLVRRVATNISIIDKNYGANKEQVKKTEQTFFNLIWTQKFIPNSPTLMNAGKDLQQLSACFVLPIEDSMESIFDTVKNAALIHKSGGGTGFSFSRLRPKNSTVKSTGGVASGPVSFMKVFNAATEAVKQGGVRRGANMAILRVDHPDILEFITCKENSTELTNFNISVGITDAFMKALKDNTDYELINPHNKEVVKKLSATDIWQKIVSGAWHNGEPGIVFLDRLNAANPTPEIGEIESTNPCGEQPLLPFESCNLGSINLSKYVTNKEINWSELAQTVFDAVHFLDNVIDANNYPLKQIDETTKSNRKIGLGVMGFADLLLKLEIPYNSEQAVEMAEKVMQFIQEQGRIASTKLAKVRGSFPNYDKSIFKNGEPMRNATITTIAPTGSISILAGCSSGIEPVFAYAFVRNVLDNDRLIEVHAAFEDIMKEKGYYSQSLMEQVSDSGNLHNTSLPQETKDVFVTAHDITPYWHMRIQAAFQNHVDNAVSKTVNFPNEASREDVAKVFKLAYDHGCKGVTIYRDGSRDQQVLSAGIKSEPAVVEGHQMTLDAGMHITPRPRPEETFGITKKYNIGGCGKLYVTVNQDENGICEVFTNTGSEGCEALADALARLISITIRAGIDIESILNQLKGIRCVGCIVDDDTDVLSCPDAIAQSIEKVVKGYASLQLDYIGGPRNAEICPEPGCNGLVVHQDGCYICRNCGFTKCS
ncbi:vitamin B12-dependent ribonucleotide reductase [Clostridium sp. 'deep sea']|nr:vitamin B12-dependent ribonucleotide reductase [Clostridium sp. 'deep sea']